MAEDKRTWAERAADALEAWSHPRGKPEPREDIGRLRSLIREESFGLIFTLISGLAFLLLAPMVAADMTTGLVVLLVIFLVGILGTFSIMPNWKILGRQRAIFAGVSAIIYALFGWYYATHFEKPITQRDLNQAVYEPPSVIINHVYSILSPNDDMRINVQFTNDGQGRIKFLKRNVIIQTPNGRVSKGVEDQKFAELTKQPAVPAILAEAPVERGQAFAFTAPENIAQKTGINVDTINNLRKAGGSLYIMIDLTYRDLRDNTTWRTSHCSHYDYAGLPPQYWALLAPHTCVGHNDTTRIE